MQVYTIGIAEMKVTKSPDKIVTLGLGSCIGLVLYDPISKIGGMVHIMLPTAKSSMNASNKLKFADTAILELIRVMTAAGAVRSQLIAKLAGGAHMFQSAYKDDIMNVGNQNIEMCHKVLQNQSISIRSEDTGGKSGRSLEFCCESSQLQVRTVAPKSVRMI